MAGGAKAVMDACFRRDRKTNQGGLALNNYIVQAADAASRIPRVSSLLRPYGTSGNLAELALTAMNAGLADIFPADPLLDPGLTDWERKSGYWHVYTDGGVINGGVTTPAGQVAALRALYAGSTYVGDADNDPLCQLLAYAIANFVPPTP